MVNNLSIGQMYGKYRIDGMLGQSQTSMVYKATHIDLDKTVALKIFSPDITYNPDVATYLFENAQACTQIIHPNIVQIYDCGLNNGSELFVVMHLIEGRTLAEILAKVGTINAEDALQMVKQLVIGLRAVHEKGLLHMDVRPGNIFITSNEEVKLADAALACPIPGMENVFGNPLYISPEAITGGQLDPRSDLYSLGATFFHMLAGVPPYMEGDVSSILQQHMESPLPSICDYNPEIPQEMQQLISWIMAKDPNERVISAGELSNVIDEFLSGSAMTDHAGQLSSEVEQFLLTKIAQSAEERMYIQDLLEAIASSVKQPDLPEEARELMEKIIVQEFSERFGCSQEVIEEIKQCNYILSNPQEWINEQLQNISNPSMPAATEPAAEKPKSNIIKSSQRASEFPSSKSPGLSRQQSPLAQIYAKSSGPVPEELLASKPKRNSFGKIAIMLFFLLVLAGGGYTVYAIPSFRNMAQEHLARFGIGKAPEKVKDQGSTTEKRKKIAPLKDYAKEIKKIEKLYKEKQFSLSRRLLEELQLQEGFTPQLYRKLEKEIKQRETKYAAKFPKSGWFGEKMPAGMKRLPTPGEYLWPADNSTMVYVKSGYFIRGIKGKADYSPMTKVYVSSYYIDKYEVTNEMYAKFQEKTKHRNSLFWQDPTFNEPRHPVVGISWEDARSYARWAKKRLPTEAEWEKAARGTNYHKKNYYMPNWKVNWSKTLKVGFTKDPHPRRKYPWGNSKNIAGKANGKMFEGQKDRHPHTAPVGQYAQGASPYFCEDMAGNVMEWCHDVYHKDYYKSKTSRKNPHGPKEFDNARRVCRGGSWEDYNDAVYSYLRYVYPPNTRLNTLGFRLVKDAPKRRTGSK